MFLLNVDINDLDVLVRFISFIGLHIFDSMHDLKAREHPSKDRVLFIQPRCSRGGDEELGTVCTRTSVSHTDGVRPVEGACVRLQRCS